MITDPSRFGSPIGGFKPLTEQPITIDLQNSGVNRAVSAAQLEDGEASNAIDVRFTKGGITMDYGVSNFGVAYSGADPLKQVVGLANYDTLENNSFLMRLRSTGWDRWNGTDWATVGSGLTGTPADRYYTATIQDLFVAARFTEKIKSWDGVDADPVQDLSADAPIAKFITKIGTRLLAAYVKIGTVVNPNLVAWCADGDVTEWTDPNLGAGSAEPPVEGSSRKAGFITGLSTLQRGAVIYRQSSIQLATLTGLGSQPFRFTTLDFSHGTESPYSIASGGMKVGDFFLGEDYMVYNFDGETFTPIGMPIYDFLRDGIPNRAAVIGVVDTNEQEYYLAYPADAISGFLVEAWVFNIREWARTGRLVWRRRSLPNNTISFGYGLLGTVSDPIVDTITDIVDTIFIKVNDWANAYGPERILFGDDSGQVIQIDKTLTTANGKWESKLFTFGGHEIQVDRVRLTYMATTVSTVAIAVSLDGGLSYTAEKIYNLAITASGPQIVSDDFRVTGRSAMFRIRPLTGFCTVSQMEVTIQDRGAGRA